MKVVHHGLQFGCSGRILPIDPQCVMLLLDARWADTRLIEELSEAEWLELGAHLEDHWQQWMDGLRAQRQGLVDGR